MVVLIFFDRQNIISNMNDRSYFPNYFSITDICVTQTKFKCEIERPVRGLGFLDPDSVSDNLQIGQIIEIPMWVLMEIEKYISSRVKVPEAYSRVFKEICDADAYSVDLGKVNKYYYEFGRYVNGLNLERNENSGLLQETCRQRARILIDLINNSQSTDIKLDTKFDQMEIELYKKGCRANTLLSKWLLCHSQGIEISELVSNHKKRKRAAMEYDEKAATTTTTSN